jgi:hypothetical protein
MVVFPMMVHPYDVGWREELQAYFLALLSGETVLCLCCQGHVVAHRFSLLRSAVAQNAFW